MESGEAGILWRNSNGGAELWNSNGSGGLRWTGSGCPSTPAGRSPEPAISTEPAKTAFCGATPMAARCCGTPTARAGSLRGLGRRQHQLADRRNRRFHRDRRGWHSVAQRATETPRSGTRTARAASLARTWALSAPVGRSPAPAISPEPVKPASCGATPAAARSSGTPNGSGGFTYQNLGVVNTSWQVAETGDFTGSGQSGILWRNTSGDTELWNPNGSGGFAYQDLGVVATNWSVQKIFA